MSQKTTTVAASETWPTSGTANAASIGLTVGTISGTNLRHVGAPLSDLWPNSSATGYIAGDTGTSVTLRIDAATGANALFGTTPANGNLGHSSVWVRAVATDPTLAGFTANPATNYAAASNSYGSSPSVNLLHGVCKNAAQPAAGSGQCLFVYPGSVTGGSSVSVAELGYCRNMKGDSVITAGSDVVANLSLGVWDKWGIRVLLGASGQYGLLINGFLVSVATVDTTGMSAANANDVRFTFPARDGIQWQFGTMDSDYVASGASSYVDLITNYTYAKSLPVEVCLPVTQTTATASTTETDHFTVTPSGATVKWGVRPIGGQLGFRDKTDQIVAYMPSGTTIGVYRKRNIGALNYSANRCKWVWRRNIRFRTACPGFFWIYNSANSATIVDIRWTAAGLLQQGTNNTLVGIGTEEKVFDLGVCFWEDGRVTGMYVDKTTNFAPTSTASRKTVHRFVLDDWAGGTTQIGQTLVFGSSTAATTFEVGGEILADLPGLAAVDSYVETAHSLKSFMYIAYTGVSGSPVKTGGTSVAGHTSGQTATIIAAGSGVGAADKWILVYTNNTWTTDSQIDSTGGSFTGCGAASFPTWVGHGAVTVATFLRSETCTSAGGAQVKLLTSGILDSTYIPANCMGVLPTSGTLEANAVLTGASTAQTTIDVPVVGCYLASHGSSYSATVYNNLRDAEAAGLVEVFPPSNPSATPIMLVAPVGRAGKTFTELLDGIGGGIGGPVHLVVLGGLANALNSATTPTLAATIAAREADAAIALFSEVVEAGGVVTYEEAEFGNSSFYMWSKANARDCYNAAIAQIRSGLAKINRDGKIWIRYATGTFPSTSDEVHYNATGAARKAAEPVVPISRTTGGGGGSFGAGFMAGVVAGEGSA